MEKERKQDRSWTGKELLQRHKKIKLAIKDAIEDVRFAIDKVITK